MLIGVIADDFTGASDIANTLAKGIAPEGGVRTAQFAGVPTSSQPVDVEAGVVALKSRTAPIDEAITQSLDALRWLVGQGCRQIVFKYCSTFDSTKAGNIGPVADALADALQAERVVFCPAFPTTARTIFQGHLFVNDRPLNECGMEHHPLTPMTDADIRRWLAHQTKETVAHIPYETVLQGVAVIRRSLSAAEGRFVVADAVTDADLLALGDALCDAPLVTGGSGIALGLPRNLIRAGTAAPHKPASEAVNGPDAIIAGSCSGATRRQVEVHAKCHPTLAIDVAGVMAGKVTADTLIGFFEENIGCAPLAYSSGTPGDVETLQRQFGRKNIAVTLDALFSTVAAALVARGFRRIVVAGGETSGAVCQAVCDAAGEAAMTVGAEIDPGVPVLTVGSATQVALALKSGNFGAADFFAKALRIMGGEA